MGVETDKNNKMTSEKKQQNRVDPWADFLTTCQEQQAFMFNTFAEGIEQYQNHTIQILQSSSRALEEGVTVQKVTQELEQSLHPPPPTASIGSMFIKATQAMIENPSRLLQAQGELVAEMSTLWQKLLSVETEEKIETTGDKRFRHEAWQTVPYYLFLKEYYLITSRWLEKTISQIEGLDEKTAQKIQFYTKQMLDAASPTNSPFMNPEVLEEFVKTKGESLKKGLETLLQDVETGQWMKMTDPSAFKLGETLASTKGEVVYRNHLFELIHYAPLTEQQYSVPLLIIPAWINKYYIFDLSTANSFAKWMVEQGHNVFIISWVNPGPELASMTFEDYLLDGAYRACEVVSSLTKSPSLHTMGFCVGGNLLTVLNAYLAKVPAPFALQTTTLLATIFDFDKIGDLKVFMDEEHLQSVEKTMAQNGLLSGDVLKSIFSLLRPNELVWTFFIKNYFLGQIPPAFDFLYWNSDSPRLPESIHRFLLRKFFQENLFMKPGGITIKGIPLDLRDITTPTFLLSTVNDHISPWVSTYPAVQLFKGPVEFILAGSGHVAGVINHPSNNKYGFFTNPYLPEKANEWFETSTKNEGSWWTAWNSWVTRFSGEKISPIMTYPFLGSAPGSYVMMQ